MRDARLDVLGIGNAIVDVLTHADDAWLDAHDLVKGTMTLVDEVSAHRLYAGISAGLERSGGSAANTMAGLASLGGRAAYVGKLRDDALGRVFESDLRQVGVLFRTRRAPDGPPTGRCLVFVTPDAQRTMQTFLGASATLGPEDVDAELVRDARITYLEGYLWDPPPAKEAFLAAARIAHEAGRQVALSLSDRFCVDRHRDEFRELVRHHVDVLFANEDEIRALYEEDDLAGALAALRGTCAVAAITRGAAGSVVLAGGRTVEVPAEPVPALVDTTGAGDLYAAGFLYGLTRDLDPARCGRIGSLAAAEVVSHFGARPEVPLASLLDEATNGGTR